MTSQLAARFLRPEHWWWVASLAALSTAFLARALTGGDVHRALPVDVVVLMLAASVVLAAVRRGGGFSPQRRAWHGVLALSFALGAVRAVLWWAGVPITLANGIAFGIGSIVLVSWLSRRAVRRRRTSVGGEPQAPAARLR